MRSRGRHWSTVRCLASWCVALRRDALRRVIFRAHPPRVHRIVSLRTASSCSLLRCLSLHNAPGSLAAQNKLNAFTAPQLYTHFVGHFMMLLVLFWWINWFILFLDFSLNKKWLVTIYQCHHKTNKKRFFICYFAFYKNINKNRLMFLLELKITWL